MSERDPDPTEPVAAPAGGLTEPGLAEAAVVEGLRERAARGALINSAFFVGLGTLGLLKAFIVAGFLTTAQFGVWGIVYLALLLIVTLKNVAVGQKYVQQDEPDQELAFQKAFTLELLSSAILTAIMLGLAPVLVLVYGRSELLLPGLAVALVIPGYALQAPQWVFYRRMDFLKQRLLVAADPITAFGVTVALAILGAGYWSLIAGMVAGSLAGAVVAVAFSPYRLAWRYEHESMREYFSFSWPLMIAAASALLIAQLSVLLGELALGLAGVGAIALAAQYSAYSNSVDQIVTQTLYPAICRVRERAELLREVFIKSNRLTLMWGMPFGIALSLFAGDLIHFGIGDRWSPALVLFQVFGVTSAVAHIGFNWSAFYQALGNTRPVAVVNATALLVFLAVPAPLLLLYNLNGFAIGMGIWTAIGFAQRWYYIRRLFPDFQIFRYFARAISPTLPAAAAVLAFRSLSNLHRTLEVALLELAAYALITLLLTYLFERPLIAEVVSYVRRPSQAAPA
jgi:O-antigen/teichoic acid export membrane protein